MVGLRLPHHHGVAVVIDTQIVDPSEGLGFRIRINPEVPGERSPLLVDDPGEHVRLDRLGVFVS